MPLLIFALAGRRVAERVRAFRRHQREIRITAGVVTILLAVALVFNLPAALQRAIPDYTRPFSTNLAAPTRSDEQLNLGGAVNDQNTTLSNCTDGATELENCGTAPDIKGISQWLNTPGGAPVDLKQLHGKVVLIDFWAYSCINCQRSIPHVVGWYNAYTTRDSTLSASTPRVRLRARQRQRRRRHRRARDHLPGRDGQRLRDLDQLPQPVLAGPLPDRRQRHRPPYQVRRRRLRRHRTA